MSHDPANEGCNLPYDPCNCEQPDPVSDLRAAVEKAAWQYQEGDLGDWPYKDAPRILTLPDVLALIDAHQCYDEAALAEAMHEASEKHGSYDWDWVFQSEAIAAIVARLRQEQNATEGEEHA